MFDDFEGLGTSFHVLVGLFPGKGSSQGSLCVVGPLALRPEGCPDGVGGFLLS